MNAEKRCSFCKQYQNRPINRDTTRSCSKYVTLERTARRPRSVTQLQNYKLKKKHTPCFRTYSRRALYDLSETLHGDRARRAHQKRCHSFFDPAHSFSYGKIGLIDRRAVSQQ